jgi:hypothetical protein
LILEQKEKTHEQTGEDRCASPTDWAAAEIESRSARMAGAVSAGVCRRRCATRAPDGGTTDNFAANVDNTADTRS